MIWDLGIGSFSVFSRVFYVSGFFVGFFWFFFFFFF